uniref:Uncharacterized protein n=1 Tax=Clytia hemisphaerica TaxID=252671 RepID=A0A7M5XG82_9CNID|eukprot:TCONS_00047598-protein
MANCGEVNSRQILFDIIHEPKYTEEEVKDLLSKAIYPPNVGTELLFENRYCRVWDFYLEPDGGDPLKNAHHHVLDYVFVYVACGRLLGYHPDGRPGLFDSVMENNEVVWEEIPSTAAENVEYAHAGKNGLKNKITWTGT